MTENKEVLDVRTNLLNWLHQKMPEAKNIKMNDFEKPGMGFSNETFLFDINWEENGQQMDKNLVMRSAPQDGIFPEYDLQKQFKVMSIVKETKAVPIPDLLWYEGDTRVTGVPFFLMEKVNGVVPVDFPVYHSSGVYYDASPEQRAKMWWGTLESIAKIHALDWKALGLSFLGVPTGGVNPVERRIAYWENYLKWVKETPEESHPTIEAALAWLKKNVYEPDHISLCWGDSRMGNTMFCADKKDVLAILDWEMSFLGDPEADLAWGMHLDWFQSDGAGIPRCEGSPSYDDTVKRYEELTGRKVKNLFFNEVLSAVRFGLIMVAVFKKLKRQGIPIDDDMILNNGSTRCLSELLDLPSPGPKPEVLASTDEITAVLQFCFSGPNGYDWHIKVDKGQGTRHEGKAENPNGVMRISLEDWNSIQSGEMSSLDAFSSGSLVMDGDMMLFQQCEELINKLKG